MTVVIGLALFLSHPVQAHVLISDQSKAKGAILHIVPDDDPIAGKPATLFFDAQGGLLHETSTVLLRITQGTDETVIETSRDGSLITAEYTFPSQGIYGLTYEITNGATSYIFTQTTRVSRGVSAQPAETTRYIWAESLLIASGVGAILLAIVACNRRREIATQSSF